MASFFRRHRALPAAFTALTIAVLVACLSFSEAVGGFVTVTPQSLAVIAQGGAAAVAPPSSKTAFVIAAELGSDYVQAEVRETRDGALVAYNRDSLGATSDVFRLFPERASGPIGAFSFAELSQLDLGDAFGRRNPELAHPCFGGSRIVSLPGLAGLSLKGRRSSGLYLSLPPGGDAAPLVEMLRGSRHLTRGQILVEATSLDQLKAVRSALPEAFTFLRIPDDVGVDVGALIKDAEALGAKGLSFPPSRALPWHLRRARAHGLAPWVRDVEPGATVFLYKAFGASGVFTEDPEAVLRQLGRAPYMPAEEMLNRMDAQSAIAGM